jgi:hypothetical protein
MESAAQLRLEGTVVLRVATGKAPLAVPPLALDAKAPVSAGAFTVQVGGGMRMGDGLPITVAGPLEQLAGISASAGGVALKTSSSMTMGRQRTWSFDKPAAGPVQVELTVWEGLKEVVVPFAYPAAEPAGGAKK